MDAKEKDLRATAGLAAEIAEMVRESGEEPDTILIMAGLLLGINLRWS